MEKRLIVYDFETTGFTHSYPVQIGIMVIEKDGTSNTYMNYIQCEMPIEPGAYRIHKISEAKVKALGKIREDVMEVLNKLINQPDTIVIGHNILGHDNAVLNKFFKEYGYQELPDSDCFDTSAQMKMEMLGWEKPFEESWGDFHQRNMRKKAKGLKHSMEEALRYYKIPFDPNRLHDAKYDVECNYQVFLKQIEAISDKYGEASIVEFLS